MGQACCSWRCVAQAAEPAEPNCQHSVSSPDPQASSRQMEDTPTDERPPKRERDDSPQGDGNPAPAAPASKPKKARRSAMAEVIALAEAVGGVDWSAERRDRAARQKDVSAPVVVETPSSPKKKKEKKVQTAAASPPRPAEWVECEICKQWRMLPPNVSASTLPDRWSCQDATWAVFTCKPVDAPASPDAVSDRSVSQDGADNPVVADEEGGNSLEWVQCSECGKWRALPPSLPASSLPDVWKCKDSTEWCPELAMCSAPEESLAQAGHRYSSLKVVRAPVSRTPSTAESVLQAAISNSDSNDPSEWLKTTVPMVYLSKEASKGARVDPVSRVASVWSTRARAGTTAASADTDSAAQMIVPPQMGFEPRPLVGYPGAPQPWRLLTGRTVTAAEHPSVAAGLGYAPPSKAGKKDFSGESSSASWLDLVYGSSNRLRYGGALAHGRGAVAEASHTRFRGMRVYEPHELDSAMWGRHGSEGRHRGHKVVFDDDVASISESDDASASDEDDEGHVHEARPTVPQWTPSARESQLRTSRSVNAGRDMWKRASLPKARESGLREAFGWTDGLPLDDNRLLKRYSTAFIAETLAGSSFPPLTPLHATDPSVTGTMAQLQELLSGIQERLSFQVMLPRLLELVKGAGFSSAQPAAELVVRTVKQTVTESLQKLSTSSDIQRRKVELATKAINECPASAPSPFGRPLLEAARALAEETIRQGFRTGALTPHCPSTSRLSRHGVGAELALKASPLQHDAPWLHFGAGADECVTVSAQARMKRWRTGGAQQLVFRLVAESFWGVVSRVQSEHRTGGSTLDWVNPS
jgi:hypothetical protein